MKTLTLQKGESIKFLDYTITNSLNNDGLVLLKEYGKPYESHLGNYGEATEENIDYCKKDAIIHFMIARPETFATTLVRKVRDNNSGSMHEYFALKNACKKEGIKFPEEITAGDSFNFMIWYKDKPMFYVNPQHKPIK